ncbi:hypothetical protein EB796_005462 [Bugula neritina]|uniref:Uncharacterized protein n=1 Tax=Bugula neritina TaxID=10212 RepID=A0A7J7KEF5_BUGNE|nr:hypothetical protein EB796_005462 [Bugula neritina]
MLMSDDDYTLDQQDLLLMMADKLIKTGAHAIAPLRCDYGKCARSKGEPQLPSQLIIVFVLLLSLLILYFWLLLVNLVFPEPQINLSIFIEMLKCFTDKLECILRNNTKEGGI